MQPSHRKRRQPLRQQAYPKHGSSISRLSKDSQYEQELKRVTDLVPEAIKRTIQAKKQASGCKPHQVIGTCLSNMEFRDALHLRYCIAPSNLLTQCDGCGAKFSTAHGLECKKGGLVIQCHDKIKLELQYLAARVRIPSVVRDEPQI